MSNRKGASYLEKLQDGRQVWQGNKKCDESFYGTLFEGEVKQLGAFFDEQQVSVGYEPLKIPDTVVALEKQKQNLSYWFAGRTFFSEGWTDIAQAFIQGWLANEKQLEVEFTEFSENINRLAKRLSQQKRFVTIPFELGTPSQGHRSFLQVTNETEEGILVRGTQRLPIDSLVVHELLTKASREEQETLLLVPLNSKGLSLHIEDDQSVKAQFEDVRIPWNYVLIQEKPERVEHLFHSDYVSTYPDYQRVNSLLNQLEWLTGLAFYVAQETEEYKKLHIQEALGELIQQLDILKSYVHLSEVQAEDGIIPDKHLLQTAQSQGIAFYKRTVEILSRVGGTLSLQQLYETEKNELADAISKDEVHSRQSRYQSFRLGDLEYAWAEYYKTYSKDFLKSRLLDFWNFHESGDFLVALSKLTENGSVYHG